MDCFFCGIDIIETKRNLKRLFTERSVTPKDIRDMLGFTTTTPVYKWISFSSKSLPSLENFLALSRYFGIHIEDIICTFDQNDDKKEKSA